MRNRAKKLPIDSLGHFSHTFEWLQCELHKYSSLYSGRHFMGSLSLTSCLAGSLELQSDQTLQITETLMLCHTLFSARAHRQPWSERSVG